MGVVIHDGHPYSMPPDAIGLPGTLYLYRDARPDRRRSLQRRPCAAIRSRATARSCPSIAPSVWPRSRASARGAICSGSTCSISGPAPWPISPSSPIVARSIWIQDVERLHALLQTHGDAALRRAFERGLAEQAIGAEYIAHYLGDVQPQSAV